MSICHDKAYAPGSVGASDDPDLIGLRRWLATDGRTGYCPEFYLDFVIARVCKCKPWELGDVSVYWKDKALIVLSAENYAREEKAKHKGG